MVIIKKSEFRKQIESGLSFQKIGEIYGVSKKTISNIRKKWGIERIKKVNDSISC